MTKVETSEMLERAAVRLSDLMVAGRTAAQAIAVVLRTGEFEAVAGLIEADREAFVDFAWDMCG